MADIKIKTHTIYTYETTDGREFDDPQEATDWQLALEDIKRVTMLDYKFKPTDEISDAYYVHIGTHSQLKAFETIQVYHGMTASIPKLGCWYYDECVDSYINIDDEINRLKDIRYKIYNKGE